MANDKSYNGWSNYETWCANVWLTGNDASVAGLVSEMAREHLQDAIDRENSNDDAVSTLADALSEYVDENAPEMSASLYADMLRAALSEVDWREIAQSELSEIRVYCAGWNMPGYMPDSQPAQFLDADDARSYLADQMREDMDDLDNDESDDDSQRDPVATELREQADLLDASSAEDSAAEYGRTIGKTHYFLTLA